MRRTTGRESQAMWAMVGWHQANVRLKQVLEETEAQADEPSVAKLRKHVLHNLAVVQSE